MTALRANPGRGWFDVGVRMNSGGGQPGHEVERVATVKNAARFKGLLVIGRCVVLALVVLAVAPSCGSNTPTSLDLSTSGSVPPSVSRPDAAPLAPPTTTPGPTLGSSITALAADISDDDPETAFLRALDARNECNYAPERCDFAAIALAGSPHDRYVRKTMDFRVHNNLRARRGAGSFEVRVDDVREAGHTAFVTTCTLDSIVIFDAGTDPGPGDDIVFDDSTVSHKVTWRLQLVDQRWQVAEGVTLDKLTGDDLCGF